MCDCCKPKTCEKGKEPGTCADEQVKECHGDAKEHDCAKTEVKAEK